MFFSDRNCVSDRILTKIKKSGQIVRRSIRVVYIISDRSDHFFSYKENIKKRRIERDRKVVSKFQKFRSERSVGQIFYSQVLTSVLYLTNLKKKRFWSEKPVDNLWITKERKLNQWT